MGCFIGRRNIGKLTFEKEAIMSKLTTPFKEFCCKNCNLCVLMGGHYLCTKYCMTVSANDYVCPNIERRFTYADQNKTIVHNSEVVVKKF